MYFAKNYFQHFLFVKVVDRMEHWALLPRIQWNDFIFHIYASLFCDDFPSLPLLWIAHDYAHVWGNADQSFLQQFALGVAFLVILFKVAFQEHDPAVDVVGVEETVNQVENLVSGYLLTLQILGPGMTWRSRSDQTGKCRCF